MGFSDEVPSAENPATWSGALQHLLPATSTIRKVEHHAAVPYKDVPALMAELRQNESVSAKALMFTILTVSRTGETLGAKWDEIDFADKIWTVAPARMKADREHRVALTEDAIAIVKSMPRDQKYVFHNNAGRKLSNMAMLQQLLRGMRDDGVTVHGFRSSFRDWAAEQTTVRREVVEACLAHAVEDAAELAYNRSAFLKKHREVMEGWARFLRT